MVDSQRRAEVAEEEIRLCLESEAGTIADLQWAYTILKRSYRHSLRRQPHSSHKDLDKVLDAHKSLYQ